MRATWLLVGSYDTNLHCIDAATGKAVWTHTTDNYINGSPALLPSGEVLFGGCDSYIHVLRLEDGAETRQIESDAYIASSVAVRDGLGYVGNYGNLVIAFDPKSGEIKWKYRDRNFPYFSSAAVTADRVIIGCRDKRLHCLDRATGKAVWTFQTRGQVESSPVVCGDAIIVGSEDGRLYCVNLADGAERWAYEIGAPVTASPAVSDGFIVVGAEDGNIYAFKSPPSSAPSSNPLPQNHEPRSHRNSRTRKSKHDDTEVGNYFVANYPPFSYWDAETAQTVGGLLAQAGDARRRARRLLPRALLPEALPLLLLPRLHR